MITILCNKKMSVLIIFIHNSLRLKWYIVTQGMNGLNHFMKNQKEPEGLIQALSS
jgi:hypothetical protein